MRLFLFFLVLLIPTLGTAQSFYPVKINKKWGLINSDGKLVKPPIYDAIGEFKKFGYAVFQLDGKTGLFDKNAEELIPPLYDDLKPLDTFLFSVLDTGVWKVINEDRKTILHPGFKRVEVWNNGIVTYLGQGGWGMVNKDGEIVSEEKFNYISPVSDDIFQTVINGKLGLIDKFGDELLSPQADLIRTFSDSLFFYRTQKRWGAVNHLGRQVIPPDFDSYKAISATFIKLNKEQKNYLFSTAVEEIITKGAFQNFYGFSKNLVMVKHERLLGLLDECGGVILPLKYNEIQKYGRDYFRVNFQDKWGVVDKYAETIIPFQFDYIAPLKGNFCIVIKNNLFGLCNFRGEQLIPADFNSIELSDNRAKGFRGDSLNLYDFDEYGNLLDQNNFQEHFTISIGKEVNKSLSQRFFEESDFVLDEFEWFYSPANDKWGLRKLSDGGIQIAPIYDYVKVEKDIGLTLVGVRKLVKVNYDKTTFRYDMVYGLVKNETGFPICQTEFLNIRLEDFRKGFPLAGCVFENNKHGLLLKSGSALYRDYAFIGEFHDGVARMSAKGTLTAKLKAGKYEMGNLNRFLASHISSSRMINVTSYDQKFEKYARLSCEDCEWGYFDTLGRVAVIPKYDYAFDFINEVGIVSKKDKWGAVNNTALEIIPLEFDEIHFLENTNNKIIRIYKKEQKYGLVDTLGNVNVSAVFDDIGSFSEGLLAVKSHNLWGFVNRYGREKVTCRFSKVNNFSEGLASVKIGTKWGFIDVHGDLVIRPRYRRAGNFNYGLAWVFGEEGVGYINRNDEMVIIDEFDNAFDFEFGVARVMVEGKYGLIDRKGKYIIRPSYGHISEFDQNGLAKVRYGSKNIRYGLINLKGKQITNLDYRKIGPFSEGFAAVRYQNKYGFINTKGELVISAKYSQVGDFSEGRAAIKMDGVCGYIDTEGNYIVDPQFSKCLDYKDGNAIVYKGAKKAGLVNQDGKVIIEPGINGLLDFTEGRGLVRDSTFRFYYITEQEKLYDGYYEKAREFQHGVAVVKMKEGWGIINQKGVKIIPPKYDKISNFEQGYAKVRINGFNGLTNLQGETIIQPDYEYISYAGDGLFRVEQGDKIGYFDADGNWVWNLSQ